MKQLSITEMQKLKVNDVVYIKYIRDVDGSPHMNYNGLISITEITFESKVITISLKMLDHHNYQGDLVTFYFKHNKFYKDFCCSDESFIKFYEYKKMNKYEMINS